MSGEEAGYRLGRPWHAATVATTRRSCLLSGDRGNIGEIGN